MMGAVTASPMMAVLMTCVVAWHVPPPRASQESGPPIKVGDEAPPLFLTTQTGRSVHISVSGRPRVLYVISPGCGWCARNTANITVLAKARGDEYSFIGISLKREGLAEFLKESPQPFEVYVATDRSIKEYGLGTMPSTIVTSKAGVVVKKWNGAFNNSLKAVEDYFNVKMPGVTPPKAPLSAVVGGIS